MNYQPYLFFTLGGSQYGIAAEVVQELFLLPALTPIAEAVAEVIGILNLRENILPVIDLKQRLGKARQPYTPQHVVIVITLHQQSVGLLVDQVHDVEAIAATDVASNLDGHLLTQVEQRVTAGLAKHNAQLITLLNPEALINGSAGSTLSPALPAISPPAEDGNEFLAQFSAAERALLQQRATGLMTQTQAENLSGLTALAIVGLQGEHFALGLETVQEFTDVTQITPIPCCPRHIVGNMNLRGEILTLVDIRQFLQLNSQNQTPPAKAVITRIDQLTAGIVVDEVFDVVYLRPSELSSTPTAIHSADNEYLRGVAPYHQGVMSILDLPKLLTQGELVVNQSV